MTLPSLILDGCMECTNTIAEVETVTQGVSIKSIPTMSLILQIILNSIISYANYYTNLHLILAHLWNQVSKKLVSNIPTTMKSVMLENM